MQLFFNVLILIYGVFVNLKHPSKLHYIPSPALKYLFHTNRYLNLEPMLKTLYIALYSIVILSVYLFGIVILT